MATYLFCWELGAGAGHCTNILPLAEGLIKRGHTVFVAARELTTAGAVLGRLQVRLIATPVLRSKPIRHIPTPRSFAHVLHNTGFSHESQLFPLQCAVRNILDLIRPDVLVCEHAPLALLASRFCKVRRALIGTGFFAPPDQSPMADLRPWLGSAPEEMFNIEHEILVRVNAYLEGGGISPLSRLSQLYSDADENFLLTFPELDHYQNRGSASYWGMWTPSQDASPEWGHHPGPRLFGYLKESSSNWDLSKFCGELGRSPVNALIYSPGLDPSWAKEFTSTCRNVRLIPHPVDIKSVIREASIAVLNGNAGVSTQLILNGIPQLNIPLYLEQTHFSMRVSQTGAGLMTPSDKPELYAESIERLIEDGRLRTGARQFQSKYVDYDANTAMTHIVDRLELMLRCEAKMLGSSPPQ